LQATPEPAFDIALLLTSDEEGPRSTAPRSWSKSCASAASAWTGASGEPTSVKQTGDMIKNGRAAP
jgi:succinyl-diaminopimelate desuccinylase